MVRIERIDDQDSFMTTFKIEIKPNQYQEVQVPTFFATLAESQINAMNFNTEKAKKGKTTILE